MDPMGRWDDKITRWRQKLAHWKMTEYPLHERVLTNIIENKARTNPNHVVFQFGDTPITFAELNEHINRAAHGFRELGVKAGDTVAIMMPNGPEFLYSWFGLNKIGAIEVPINMALKGKGLAYQLTQSDCGALVADTKYLDSLLALEDALKGLKKIVWYSADEDKIPSAIRCEAMSFSELLDHPCTAPKAEVSPKDPASILYTSGTTGLSKGVVMSHNYWYEIWSECVKYARYTNDDVLYSGLPF